MLVFGCGNFGMLIFWDDILGGMFGGYKWYCFLVIMLCSDVL